MIRVEHVKVFNFEGAIRGLRNPMNSWDKSDSDVAFHAVENFAPDDPMREKYYEWNDKYNLNIKIGKNDLALMKKLYKAGTEHRKYLRQIFVSMDIIAPLYWISEFDTYKIGTVRNSCSFMHKGVSKPFDITDFSIHDSIISPHVLDLWQTIIESLNLIREAYLATKDSDIFQFLRCLLPCGYNQRFTVTMNYENVVSIIKQRENHKLDEWREFVGVLKNLPYIKEIME